MASSLRNRLSVNSTYTIKDMAEALQKITGKYFVKNYLEGNLYEYSNSDSTIKLRNYAFAGEPIREISLSVSTLGGSYVFDGAVNLSIAGKSLSSIVTMAAMCIAVGKVSFELWLLLISSLG